MDKSEYRKILNELVDDSFPTLKKDKIYLMEMYTWKFTGAEFRLPFNRWLICFHPRTKEWGTEPIRGFLAHELCHFEIYKKDCFLKTWVFWILYWFSPKIRRKIERETDKLTIEKGYGKELYEALKKSVYSDRDKYYFSLKEIKDYAKSIGKWQ